MLELADVPERVKNGRLNEKVFTEKLPAADAAGAAEDIVVRLSGAREPLGSAAGAVAAQLDGLPSVARTECLERFRGDVDDAVAQVTHAYGILGGVAGVLGINPKLARTKIDEGQVGWPGLHPQSGSRAAPPSASWRHESPEARAAREHREHLVVWLRHARQLLFADDPEAVARSPTVDRDTRQVAKQFAADARVWLKPFEDALEAAR